MTERFRPIYSLKKVGNAILLGGQRKRIEGSSMGDITESRFRDGLRAFAPGAIVMGMIGALVPMGIVFWQEFNAYMQSATTVDTTGNALNGWVIVGGGVLGAVIGGITQAEHSRRLGKSWETDAENAWQHTEQSVEGFIDKYK